MNLHNIPGSGDAEGIQPQDSIRFHTRSLQTLSLSFTTDTFSLVRQVALCFSPVGSTLRVRSRKFPAMVNCTAIDWFHEWPQEALESVSLRFLQEVENIEVSLHQPVVLISWTFIAFGASIQDVEYMGGYSQAKSEQNVYFFLLC